MLAENVFDYSEGQNHIYNVIIYYTHIQSVEWRIQMNIAPVSGRALVSSDSSGKSLYTSPYWLFKCFIFQILRIYCMKGLLTKNKFIMLKHC